MYPLTPWVKKLLLANIVAFIVTAAVRPLYAQFALVPFAVGIRPWTIITYMFLHAGLMHLFWNMIGLIVFGPRLEERLGGKDFLWLYLLGGVGGAAFSFFFAPSSAVVGASAAVYAVMLAFALYWPYERLLIWGILPVPAWVLATVLVVVSLWSGVSVPNSGTAHFAHLGGLAFGFAYLKWRDWHRGAAKRDFQRKLNQTPAGLEAALGDKAAIKRWQSIDLGRLHELNREEVVQLLDKVNRLGARSLTVSERQFLDRLTATN